MELLWQRAKSRNRGFELVSGLLHDGKRSSQRAVWGQPQDRESGEGSEQDWSERLEDEHPDDGTHFDECRPSQDAVFPSSGPGFLAVEQRLERVGVTRLLGVKGLSPVQRAWSRPSRRAGRRTAGQHSAPKSPSFLRAGSSLPPKTWRSTGFELMTPRAKETSLSSGFGLR